MRHRYESAHVCKRCKQTVVIPSRSACTTATPEVARNQARRIAKKDRLDPLDTIHDCADGGFGVPEFVGFDMGESVDKTVRVDGIKLSDLEKKKQARKQLLMKEIKNDRSR